MQAGPLKAFCQVYRGEIIIAVSVGVITFLGTLLVAVLMRWTDPIIMIAVAVGILLTTLLLAILFSLKRIVESRFRQVNRILIDQFGFAWRENQYFRRLRHYSFEKEYMGRYLVEQVLPVLAQRVRKDHPHLKMLNLILDSGTTITPIFKHLFHVGVSQHPVEKLTIYTNNLAGIDEIHKLDATPYSALSERDFVLISGQPLNKYRATTGSVTQEFLRTFWRRRDESSEDIVTVAILTANWFLGTPGLDDLALCARGEGHFEFKKNVCDHSDFVILLAPLGKVLCLSDVQELNDMLPIVQPNDAYRSYRLPADRKTKTYLLTTFRPSDSLSPLGNLSTRLEYVRSDDVGKNFRLWNPVPVFDPSGTTAEVRKQELPHSYVKDNFERVYKTRM